MRLEFAVLGKPEPAGSKRAFPLPPVQTAAGKWRTPVVVTDDNPKSKAWQRHVAACALDARDFTDLLDGPLEVRLAFVLTRPKGHTGKRGLRASARPHPTVKPDVLKLARGVEDALTGIVWIDDAQIVREVLTKEYGEHPGVVVQVIQIPTEGPIKP